MLKEVERALPSTNSLHDYEANELLRATISLAVKKLFEGAQRLSKFKETLEEQA